MEAAARQCMDKVVRLVPGSPLGRNLVFWAESGKYETMGKLEKL